MPTHQVEDQPPYAGRDPVLYRISAEGQTSDTPDHLTSAGIRYIGDWVLDDQPCDIATANGPPVAMPYPLELNDVPMMAVQHHLSDVFLERVRDSFGPLLR